MKFVLNIAAFAAFASSVAAVKLGQDDCACSHDGECALETDCSCISCLFKEDSQIGGAVAPISFAPMAPVTSEPEALAQSAPLEAPGDVCDHCGQAGGDAWGWGC